MKIMGLAFVAIISGCHAPPEGAVCPAPEEEVAEPEPLPDKIQTENDPELKREMERAEEYLRKTRR